MRQGGGKTPIGRIPDPAIFFVGAGRFVRQTDPGCIYQSVFSRFVVFVTGVLGHVLDIEIPAIVPKDIIERPTDPVATEIRQFFIPRTGPGR